MKAVYTSFINACRRAGLENVSPHTLRHTFASHLIMAGVNLKAVQTLLGHKSIKITMDIYGHLTPDHLEASINRLPYGKEPHGKVVPLFAESE